ncbi:uncharacterized protein LOC131889516 [Tigriopus californicus]|uniref:uncharacterized protein LOC131889516 n=1 Tax=Tigriopus californicus TaxID=6832 RepID=UPI0027DA44A2|nr:uncharacterized protein LOC131889516 [Tigriopus californicus]
MAAKRQKIADLLHAHVPVKQICEIVDCKKTLVYDVRRMVKEGKSLERTKGSGGHNKIITDNFLNDLHCKIEADPSRSIRKLAKDLNVSRMTVLRAVGQLGLKSYVRRRRQLLSESSKNSRLERGKILINQLKKKPRSTVLVFSDKKNWTVDQARNARNDRFLAYCVDEVPCINQTKHPASAMMLGVVSSDGKRMPPYWFPKGLRVGAKEYLEVMQEVVKPWLDATYPDNNYIWQQDSAPGHKAKVVQTWCKDNLAGFWPSNFWPPSSLDCAPLDYGIWGYVESKACATPHSSVDAMKAAVEREWAAMDEEYVSRVCRSFRPRLEAMVEAEGGHFEV